MKSHEQCAALLDAFIDGALSEPEAAQVREHLTECAECQSYVSDALSMRELFPGVEDTAAPDGFAESVMSSLPAQKIVWRTQWKKIALPLAACIAMALFVRGVSVTTTGGATKTAAVADVGGVAADTDAGAGIMESMIMEAPDAEEAATLYGVDLEESAPEADENQTTAVTFAAPDTGADSDAKKPSYKSANGAERAETQSETSRTYDAADTMPPQAPESAPAPEPSKPDADAYRKTSGAAESEDIPYAAKAAAQSVESGAAMSDGEEFSSAAPNAFDGGAAPNALDDGASASGATDSGAETPSGAAQPSDGASASGAADSGAASDNAETPSDAAQSSGGAETPSGMTQPSDALDGGAASDGAELSGMARLFGAEPDTSDAAGNADTPDGAKNPPSGGAVASAPPDTDAISQEDAPQASQPDDSASDAVTQSLALSVTLWTLDADAAPIMERYPPDAVTDGGKWYVMTPPQFLDFCERFPDIEITAGPDFLNAASLPDGAPPLTISDAVYIFVPNP